LLPYTKDEFICKSCLTALNRCNNHTPKTMTAHRIREQVKLINFVCKTLVTTKTTYV